MIPGMERSKKNDLEFIWDKYMEILGTKEKKCFHSNQDGHNLCSSVVTVTVVMATYLTGATKGTKFAGTVHSGGKARWQGWQVATSHCSQETEKESGAGLTPFYSVWTQNMG